MLICTLDIVDNSAVSNATSWIMASYSKFLFLFICCSFLFRFGKITSSCSKICISDLIKKKNCRKDCGFCNFCNFYTVIWLCKICFTNIFCEGIWIDIRSSLTRKFGITIGIWNLFYQHLCSCCRYILSH